MAKRVPLGAGLRNEPLVGKARQAQIHRRATQMVAKDKDFRTGGERRRGYSSRVQASQGFKDRRINPTRASSGTPRRKVAPRASQRPVGKISQLLKASPISLGVSALIQPRSLGDGTRGNPMNSPAQVQSILAARKRKARRVPRNSRGLR